MKLIDNIEQSARRYPNHIALEQSIINTVFLFEKKMIIPYRFVANSVISFMWAYLQTARRLI